MDARERVGEVLAGWTMVWQDQDTLVSLGLDSIDRIEMLWEVEQQTGVQLDDLLHRDETLTVGQLVFLVQERQTV